MKRLLRRATVVIAVFIGSLAAVVAALNFRDEEKISASAPSFSPTPEQIARGEYLARAGNCMGCHTTRGGLPYAGGRAIPTPFGTIYSSNITPDARTGIGTWTPAHFWRAMHNGRSKSGRLLYPAFPYTEYTLVSREDSDALFAYLSSLRAAEQPRQSSSLQNPRTKRAPSA